MKIFLDFPKKYNPHPGFWPYLCYNQSIIYYDRKQGGLYELPGNPLFRAAC